MPWNTQGGGGWQGGQGPWGGRPGGGQQPPDLEEVLRRGQERLKRLLPGGGGAGGYSGRAIAIVALAALGLWLASGFYRVGPEQQGVVLRFGKLDRLTGPGLNYRLPWPIEDVLTPEVARVNRIEIGYTTAGPGLRGGRRELPEQALMLTGDENIVDINFVVQWKIADAAQFLFNIRDPEITITAAAESVMREIIGQTPIIQATTEGRRAIEARVREMLQQLMVEYGAGIEIQEVQLQKADPPGEVIDAFRDVQRAQADREREQNVAEAFANDIIPRARGEAERLLQDAEAYRQEVVARATGEAQRFKTILAEYQKAQDVTVQRLYLETMEEVLRGMSKLIVEAQAGVGSVVPYLPLPELQQRRAPAPTQGQGAAQ
ncbi:MAG: FtsH protease activity modulator HflK [Geminicoccaceae bacterium]|nr:FtsH protease activity modulator HflK [Geminicoccaceae bacterium]MCX8099904.1 FtsH protease activity modulator HflK [Geminicoccaceae bacterium]MDW8368944.1 FtsH protease activity modulator HflK [Geminicoccaceae bacterium]